MGIFNFFTKNLLTADLSGLVVTTCLPKLQKIEKSRERDFVEALLIISAGRVLNHFNELIREHENIGKILRKLSDNEKRELILIESSYFYILFRYQEGFFDSYIMDQKKVKNIMIELFKDLGECSNNYIEFFDENIESAKEIHRFYDENFVRITCKDHIESILANLEFPIYHAGLFERNNEVMVQIIKYFSNIDPADLIK